MTANPQTKPVDLGCESKSESSTKSKRLVGKIVAEMTTGTMNLNSVTLSKLSHTARVHCVRCRLQRRRYAQFTPPARLDKTVQSASRL